MRDSGSGLGNHEGVLPTSSVANAKAYIIRIVFGGRF